MRIILLFLLLTVMTGVAAEVEAPTAASKFQHLQKVLDAENSTAPSVLSSPETKTDLGGIALRMFISLGVVLLLMYVLYRLAKKLRKMDLPPSEGGKNIQLLETYHLGGQQKIVLLRLGESRVVLLGSSSENITTLADIQGAEAQTILAETQQPVVNNSVQFSETVNQMLSRFRREG